jgi:PQQ-like domain
MATNPWSLIWSKSTSGSYGHVEVGENHVAWGASSFQPEIVNFLTNQVVASLTSNSTPILGAAPNNRGSFVYADQNGGEVSKADLNTGEYIWRKIIGGGKQQYNWFTVADNGDFALVGYSDSSIHYVNSNGAVKWSTSLGSNTRAACISPSGNYIYGKEQNGNIHRLNPANGSIIKEIPHVASTTYGQMYTTDNGDLYVFDSHNQRITKYNSSLVQQWVVIMDSEIISSNGSKAMAIDEANNRLFAYNLKEEKIIEVNMSNGSVISSRSRVAPPSKRIHHMSYYQGKLAIFFDGQAVEVYNVGGGNKPPSESSFLNQPDANEVCLSGETISLSWSVSTDDEGDSISYKLEFYNGSSWQTVSTGINGTDYNFVLPSNLNVDNAKFRLTAIDSNAGQSSPVESNTFKIRKQLLLIQDGDIIKTYKNGEWQNI